jgi:CTD small phosphatase-like protein 2
VGYVSGQQYGQRTQNNQPASTSYVPPPVYSQAGPEMRSSLRPVYYGSETTQSVDLGRGSYQMMAPFQARASVAYHPSNGNYQSNSFVGAQPNVSSNYGGTLKKFTQDQTSGQDLRNPKGSTVEQLSRQSQVYSIKEIGSPSLSAQSPVLHSLQTAESTPKALLDSTRASLQPSQRHSLVGTDSHQPQNLRGSLDNRVLGSIVASATRVYYSPSRLIDESRSPEALEPLNRSRKGSIEGESPFISVDNRSALLKYVKSSNQAKSITPENNDDSFSNNVLSKPGLATFKEDKAHHGKSFMSVQLFEHEESQAYPHVTHLKKNPLVRAINQEHLVVDSSHISLDIHEDSCYNLLNKKLYCKGHQRTPLEDFFLKESVAQFKVAQYLSQNHVLRLTNIRKPHITRKKKYMLVLDIDETLVHSELIMEQSVKKTEFEDKHHDRYIEFPNPNGTSDVYGVRYRPYLMEFINRMSKIYDLSVYTASAQDYADAVMDQLDPNHTIFAARLYRDHCLPVNNMNIKNMLMFNGPNVYLVDNLIYSFAFQINQGIPICPFVDDPMDVELRDLANILEQVDKFRSMDDLLEDLLGLKDFYKHLEQASQDPAVEISPSALLEYHANSNQLNTRNAGGNTISFVNI